MTNMTAGRTRIGLVVLAAVTLTAGVCSDAVARTHKQHWHAARSFSNSHAQVVSPAPAQLPPMRYYGGPKSPMWRGTSN
jgi:hypothetical protein